MCQCWGLEPSDRPAFSKLAAFMEVQLTNMEEEVGSSSQQVMGSNPHVHYRETGLQKI